MAGYIVGDKAHLVGVWRTPGGAAVDPSLTGTVRVKVKSPAGTVTTYTYGTDSALVQDSTGVFYVDHPLDTAGTYAFRIEATGAYQAAKEGALTVGASSF